MIWLAFLLSALGWSFQWGMYVQADSPAALWCWAGAAAMFVASYVGSCARQRRGVLWWRRTAPSLLLLPLVCFASQWLFLLTYERLAMAATNGIDWLALPVIVAVRLLGFDAYAFEGTVHIQTGLATLGVALTFDKLALPLFGSLLAPGIILVLSNAAGQLRRVLWWLFKTAVVAAAYCLVRFAVVLGLTIDDVHVDAFWLPTLLGVQVAPLSLLLNRFCPVQSFMAHETAPPKSEVAFGGALLLATALLAFLSVVRLPSGNSAVSVLVDDAHSNWSWTNVPFGKHSYSRQATYSYTNLVDFIGYHYSVEVNRDRPLDELDLSRFDVLVLKTPTAPYAKSELDAVESFVEHGGGLFLIGDHTNLFGMTTHINAVADRFGIHFEDDATYDLDTGDQSRFQPSGLNPHPIARLVEGFEFETSCTIRGPFTAEFVLPGRALASEMVDYSHVNFFGNMRFDLVDRFGVFAQGVAVRQGAGRVFGFTDSTVLSNFSLFKEGRAEMVLAVIAYLNGTSQIPVYVVWLTAPALLGIVAWLLTRLGLIRPSLRMSIPAVAGGLSLSLLAAANVHDRVFRLPDPVVDYPVVVFDKDFSQFELPSMIVRGLGQSRERSFDAFYVATQRLGLVPRLRRDLASSLEESDTLVVINPVGVVYERDAMAVQQFLDRGGRLLMMVDDRGPFFAANGLLSGSGVQMTPAPSSGDDRRIGVQVDGLEQAHLPNDFDAASHELPMVYWKPVGRGRLVLVMGGQYFSQEWMGQAFNSPDEDQKLLYELEYYLFEELLDSGGAAR